MIVSHSQKRPIKIADRISNARKAALSQCKEPNSTQRILENVYGKSTPQIIESYAAYNDKWHKYIDIGK